MNRVVRPYRLPVVSLAVGLAAFGLVETAAAQSSRDKVLSTIVDATKAVGAKSVTLGAVSGDDAKFTVATTTIVTEAEGKKSTMTFGPATYTGAKPTADGGYTIDELVAEKFSAGADDGKLTAERIVVRNYVGQPAAKLKPGAVNGEKFERIEATGLVATSEDGKTVPIASVAVAASDYVGDRPRKGSFEMKGLTVPLDPKDPDMAQVTALGYSTLSLDVAMSGAWDDKTGRLDVPALSIAAADMGSLKLSFVLGGLTPEVVAQLEKAGADEAKQMELLQGLTIEKVALRYDDASFATRFMGKQAKDQGVDTKTYAKQLKVMLPMVVSMIGNKDFEKKVVSAAGAFLEAPKSLTLSAAPKQPLPVSQIMGAAMMAPQTLPTVVGAEVSAND